MGKTNFNLNYLRKVSVIFIGFLLGIFMLSGCASMKPQPRVSQYRFNFKGKNYSILSISSKDEGESCNKLIGENVVADDFNQDRIIDHIVLGDVSLKEAQKIYEYGINMAIKENKLRERLPGVNRYMHKNIDYFYEIRSFHPTNAHAFNEFKIIYRHHLVDPQITIIVDQKADGTLDKVLKGTITLEEVQSLYSMLIKLGLQKGELIKVDNMILVKEK